MDVAFPFQVFAVVAFAYPESFFSVKAKGTSRNSDTSGREFRNSRTLGRGSTAAAPPAGPRQAVWRTGIPRSNRHSDRARRRGPHRANCVTARQHRPGHRRKAERPDKDRPRPQPRVHPAESGRSARRTPARRNAESAGNGSPPLLGKHAAHKFHLGRFSGAVQSFQYDQHILAI